MVLPIQEIQDFLQDLATLMLLDHQYHLVNLMHQYFPLDQLVQLGLVHLPNQDFLQVLVALEGRCPEGLLHLLNLVNREGQEGRFLLIQLVQANQLIL